MCLWSDLPNTSANVAHALARRADGNPYTLDLLLSTDIVRENTEDAAINLDPTTVARLPNGLRDLLRGHWNSLAPDKRRCLSIAGTLGEMLPIEVLDQAVNSLGLVRPVNLVDNTWLRFVGHRQQVVEFLEAARRELAADRESSELEPWQCARWRSAVASQIRDTIDRCRDARVHLVLRSLYLRLGQMQLIDDVDSLVDVATDLAEDSLQTWLAPAAVTVLLSVGNLVSAAGAESQLRWHTAMARSKRTETRAVAIVRSEADIARLIAIEQFPYTKLGIAALIEHALCYRADSVDLRTARSSMDLAKAWISGRFDHDAELVADVLRADGMVRGYEQCLEESVQQLSSAATLYTDNLGPTNYKTLVTYRNLAYWKRRLEPGSELADREAQLETILAVIGTLDNERAATVMSNLAFSLLRTGRDSDVERARDLGQRAVYVRERVFGTDHHLTTPPTLVLSQVWMRKGLIAERARHTVDASHYFVMALAVTDRVLRLREQSGGRVRKRRRELGVHRPVGTPPRPAPPDAPPADVLHRWYVDEGRTLEQIARRQHTSKGVVGAWLSDAGIPAKPRTSREHRKHLDPVLIAELYQEREWSSAQIAAHQDVTVKLVLRTLHDHGVPVRRGGPPPRHPVDDEMDPRLTALYADPDITALLRRHRIPRRNQPGTITNASPMS